LEEVCNGLAFVLQKKRLILLGFAGADWGKMGGMKDVRDWTTYNKIHSS